MRDHPDPNAFQHGGKVQSVDPAVFGDFAQQLGDPRRHRRGEPDNNDARKDRHSKRQFGRILSQQQRQNAANHRRRSGANYNLHSFPKTRTDRG